MPAVLYVVATPIGNLADITRRAVDVLGAVALVAAEDTRRTRSLLQAIGVPLPPLIALHEHNEAAAGERVLTALAAGASVALVSDAGTPLLSDPGYALVRACHRAGHLVLPVPGPSAVTAALSVCPVPAADLRLVGFLPSRADARQRRLRSLLEEPSPLLLFEAPHRILDLLEALEKLAPDRPLFVAREMTKRFESYYSGTAAALRAALEDGDAVRGEFVVVVGAAEATVRGDAETRRVLSVLAAELSPAQAARLGARLLGRKRQELYGIIQSLGDPAAGVAGDEDSGKG